jgi:hypothetical protein
MYGSPSGWYNTVHQPRFLSRESSAIPDPRDSTAELALLLDLSYIYLGNTPCLASSVLQEGLK